MRFAICDDDHNICLAIKEHICSFFTSRSYAEPECCIYHSGMDITAAGLSFDIVFMDIEMPHMNGIETCNILAAQNHHTLFVMITSHEQYIDEAFRLHAFRFLTKPIDWNRFYRCLSEAMYVVQTSSKKIVIKHEDGAVTLYTDDIILIESHKRQSQVFTATSSYISSLNMTDWEKKLELPSFVVPARGYIVNMEHIVSLDSKTHKITMDNGLVAYVARRKSKLFTSIYLTYVDSVT